MCVIQSDDGAVVVEAPGGYPFHVYDSTSTRAGGLSMQYMVG